MSCKLIGTVIMLVGRVEVGNYKIDFKTTFELIDKTKETTCMKLVEGKNLIEVPYSYQTEGLQDLDFCKKMAMSIAMTHAKSMLPYLIREVEIEQQKENIRSIKDIIADLYREEVNTNMKIQLKGGKANEVKIHSI